MHRAYGGDDGGLRRGPGAEGPDLPRPRRAPLGPQYFRAPGPESQRRPASPMTPEPADASHQPAQATPALATSAAPIARFSGRDSHQRTANRVTEPAM